MSGHTFEYKGRRYPKFIREGNHAQYIIPTAQKVCVGAEGIDVGCGRGEWKFPDAFGVDARFDYPFNDAMRIPWDNETCDYVFSSHCLEHIPDYVGALTEWLRVIKPGGTLFLYLPSVECEYWRPENNRKHCHIFYPDDIRRTLEALGLEDVTVSGVDAAFSFSAFGFKPLEGVTK